MVASPAANALFGIDLVTVGTLVAGVVPARPPSSKDVMTAVGLSTGSGRPIKA